MKILEREDIYLEIADDVLDADRYNIIVQVFKNMPYYKIADLIIPIFIEGIDVNAVGETGINYKVDFGDLGFEFEGSRVLLIPGDVIDSRIVEVNMQREGKFIGSINIAFVSYIIFSYILCRVLLDDMDNLNKSKISRYLRENLDYPDGFETMFGGLYSLGRLDEWDFETFRDVMIQLVSDMKDPIVKRSLVEILGSVGYKVFAENIKETWRWSAGFNKINNQNWVVELV